MVADVRRTVAYVDVELAWWHEHFHHRLQSLAQRQGALVGTLAVRQHDGVPRGRVFVYMDSRIPGRAVLCYHAADFEQVYDLLLADNRVGKILAVGEVPNNTGVRHG